jgi:hypothetical protein
VEALRDGAFALPDAEPELAFEQQADAGDGLNVGGEALLWVPGAKRRLGDLAAAACEPDEGREVDGELGASCPACVAPAVAQAAGGAVGAADQASQLVEGDGVLLRDQGEQLLIAFRDLEAAPVSARSPPTFFLIRERLCCQRLLLLSDPIA